MTDCGPVPSMDNGTITATSTEYPAVATVTCDSGLSPSHNEISCDVDGNWTAVPVCSSYGKTFLPLLATPVVILAYKCTLLP